ncbi:hypothetical protein HZC09_07035, partial [Candidatus Micrarchaeota archaeon]|nr:hypothetical protein [Candidatus Micrarchaeota archaeon]
NFSLGQSGGVESYNVTFIVPASLKPGHVGVRFMVNNTNGNSGELFRSTTVSALDLKTLSQNEVMMQGYCFDVYDDRDKNGSFGERCMAIPDPTQGGMGPGGAETQPFTYANLRMNLSYLNSSFLALNGSVTNASFTIGSRSGNVCFKTAFNYTTFGFGPMSLTNVAANTFFAMFDNDTSGAYDVLVVNSSNGSLQVIDLTNTNSTHRRLFGQLNMTPFNSSALYISSSMDCPNVRFVNGSTRMDSYGASGYFDAQRLGDFKKGQFWYVPYRVTRGNVPIQGSSVSIPGFANMSFGGKGFANMLDSGYFQTFDGASDENGVAFVKANISASGEYMAIWKVNATIGGAYVEDIAKMQRDEFSFGGGAGSMVTIRSFMAFPQGFGMPPITSATQNVTANISAFDFRGQPLTGANATVIGEVFRWGPPQALEVQMFNSSSGGNVTRELIGSTGSAQLLFTKLGGWREGENVEVMARVTNTSASGTDAEIVHIGMIGFMGGGGMQPAGGGCIPGMPCGGPGPGGEQGGMGGMGGY